MIQGVYQEGKLTVFMRTCGPLAAIGPQARFESRNQVILRRK